MRIDKDIPARKRNFFNPKSMGIELIFLLQARAHSFFNGFKPKNLVLWLVFVAICVCAWMQYVEFQEISAAVRGYTPHFYVFQRHNPSAYSKNFPNGQELYSTSAFMHIYNFAYDLFSISPEAMIPFVIVFEMVLMIISSYWFFRVLFPAAPIEAIIVFLTYVVISSVRGVDLARWGAPIFIGQFYNVADALRIFGIVASIRGRIVLSFILLAGSFMNHPVIGIIGVVFCLAYNLSGLNRLAMKRVGTGILVFILIAGAWIFLAYDFSGNRDIPKNLWFKLSEIHSYHWFPLTMGVFSFQHDEVFFPFLSLMLLFLYYNFGANNRSKIDKRVVLGMIVLMFLSIFGVTQSILKMSPFLVKLAFHRATDFMVYVGVAYVANGLWKDISGKEMVKYIMATLLLISPFGGHKCFPVFISLAHTSIQGFVRSRERGSGLCFMPAMVLGVVIIVLFVIYSFFGISKPFGSSVYTGWEGLEEHFWIIAIALIIIGGMKMIFRNGVASFIVLTMFFCFDAQWIRGYQHASEYISYGAYFKEAQIWARDNTPENALFFVDPSIIYGWRDYSRRSSFGNVREWLYYGWFYSSNRKYFDEGIRRFNDLSLSLESYLTLPNSICQGTITKDVRSRFYSLGDERRTEIAQKYQIDYFVFDKSLLETKTAFPVVFENERFIVSAVPKRI